GDGSKMLSLLGKFTVVVDDDIDIRDSFALEWALSFRVRPHEDIHIIRNTAQR
ncbi:unnamed protein product, partial [marine sediment metagenome]